MFHAKNNQATKEGLNNSADHAKEGLGAGGAEELRRNRRLLVMSASHKNTALVASGAKTHETQPREDSASSKISQAHRLRASQHRIPASGANAPLRSPFFACLTIGLVVLSSSSTNAIS